MMTYSLRLVFHSIWFYIMIMEIMASKFHTCRNTSSALGGKDYSFFYDYLTGTGAHRFNKSLTIGFLGSYGKSQASNLPNFCTTFHCYCYAFFENWYIIYPTVFCTNKRGRAWHSISSTSSRVVIFSSTYFTPERFLTFHFHKFFVSYNPNVFACSDSIKFRFIKVSHDIYNSNITSVLPDHIKEPFFPRQFEETKNHRISFDSNFDKDLPCKIFQTQILNYVPV